MDFNNFSKKIASGDYRDALIVGEPLYRAAQAENFGPSSAEFMLLASGADVIAPHLPQLITALAKLDGSCVPWVAVLLHSPRTRESALAQFRLLIAGNDVSTLTNACRVITASPPSVTQEFAARLMELHRNGPEQVRSYALRALGYMRHRDSLELAATALSVEEDAMQRACGTYFKFNKTPEALRRLCQAVRELPVSASGWTTAVNAIAESGLHAAPMAPELLKVLREQTVSPRAKAALAQCLFLITLDDELSIEVQGVMRALLSAGIAMANARDSIPPETYEESLKLTPPEIDACHFLLRLLVAMDEAAGGLNQVIVQALLAKDWDIRSKAAELCVAYKLPAAETLPSLITALGDVLVAGKEDPFAIIPAAATTFLRALRTFGLDALPAQSELERFIAEADEAQNQHIVALAKGILEEIRP